MKKQHRTKGVHSRPSRKMNPVFLVFCEGDTEDAYINVLKRKRLSVKFISYVTRLSISPEIFKRVIESKKISKDDKIKTFLMYDLDRKDTIEKLAACKGFINISSNPTIELWFLLHSCEQNAAISTDNCTEKLKKSSQEWTHYKKGTFTEKQIQLLLENCDVASARAKKLPEGENPSSTVFRLIEAMDEVGKSS